MALGQQPSRRTEFHWRIAAALLLCSVACNAVFGVDELVYSSTATASSAPVGEGGAGGSLQSTSVGVGAFGGEAGAGGAGGDSGVGGGGGQGGGGQGGDGGQGGSMIITDPFCDGQFGTLGGYELCSATPTSCKFFRSVLGSNCRETCNNAGTTCLDQYDQGTLKCDEITDLQCDDGFNDVICDCKKGCGTNPVCADGLTCVDGTCLAT